MRPSTRGLRDLSQGRRFTDAVCNLRIPIGGSSAKPLPSLRTLTGLDGRLNASPRNAGPNEDDCKRNHDQTGSASDDIGRAEFLYSPISPRLLINSNMNVSTNGQRTPFATCESRINRSSARCGTSTNPVPKRMSTVRRQ